MEAKEVIKELGDSFTEELKLIAELEEAQKKINKILENCEAILREGIATNHQTRRQFAEDNGLTLSGLHSNLQLGRKLPFEKLARIIRKCKIGIRKYL